MTYPRINKTHCKIHHDAVGPTLAANLLADAVRELCWQATARHTHTAHAPHLQQQSGYSRYSSIPPAAWKLSMVAEGTDARSTGLALALPAASSKHTPRLLASSPSPTLSPSPLPHTNTDPTPHPPTAAPPRPNTNT